MEIAVSTQRLTKKFGDFVAVREVSLEVNSGEIFGFLGANGAGKTTVIRMLCGLLAPTSGNGCVGGFDIVRDRAEIKKQIGYMSQKFSLYRDLSGRDNLSFYGLIYGLRPAQVRQRIAEISAALELSDFLDRPAGSLPTGWRQRLGLATAILHRPRIVFLDEPTAGVDPAYRRRFWEILYRLADQGTTIFVTTHYMDEAEYCHRISIMHQGKLIEIGPPDELIRSHQCRNLQDTFIHLISRFDQDAFC